MRDFSRALAGLGSRSRSKTVILRKLPLVAEIEELLEDRSVEWQSSFDAKCDETSLALFGITKADTEPAEPHPDDVKDEGPMARFRFSEAAFATYNEALDRYYDFQSVMGVYEADANEIGRVSYWGKRGYDVSDGYMTELRCLSRFDRQLYVATMGILPGAKVTPYGGGRRAAQSVDEWAAALQAEAARFRPSR